MTDGDAVALRSAAAADERRALSYLRPTEFASATTLARVRPEESATAEWDRISKFLGSPGIREEKMISASSLTRKFDEPSFEEESRTTWPPRRDVSKKTRQIEVVEIGDVHHHELPHQSTGNVNPTVEEGNKNEEPTSQRSPARAVPTFGYELLLSDVSRAYCGYDHTYFESGADRVATECAINEATAAREDVLARERQQAARVAFGSSGLEKRPEVAPKARNDWWRRETPDITEEEFERRLRELRRHFECPPSSSSLPSSSSDSSKPDVSWQNAGIKTCADRIVDGDSEKTPPCGHIVSTSPSSEHAALGIGAAACQSENETKPELNLPRAPHRAEVLFRDTTDGDAALKMPPPLVDDALGVFQRALVLAEQPVEPPLQFSPLDAGL